MKKLNQIIKTTVLVIAITAIPVIAHAKTATVGDVSCNLETFKKSLMGTESGGRYNVINSIHAMGRYQFMPATLRGLSAYRNARAECKPMNKSGFASRKCADVQEAAMDEFTTRNLRYAVAKNGCGIIGKRVGGCTVTWSGLLAAMHLGGAGKCTSHGLKNASDGNMTTYRYMCKHANKCASCGPKKDGCNCRREEVTDPCTGKYGKGIWKNVKTCTTGFEDKDKNSKGMEKILKGGGVKADSKVNKSAMKAAKNKKLCDNTPGNCCFTDVNAKNKGSCKPATAVNVSGQQSQPAKPKNHPACRSGGGGGGGGRGHRGLSGLANALGQSGGLSDLLKALSGLGNGGSGSSSGDDNSGSDSDKGKDDKITKEDLKKILDAIKKNKKLDEEDIKKLISAILDAVEEAKGEDLTVDEIRKIILAIVKELLKKYDEEDILNALDSIFKDRGLTFDGLVDADGNPVFEPIDGTNIMPYDMNSHSTGNTDDDENTDDDTGNTDSSSVTDGSSSTGSSDSTTVPASPAGNDRKTVPIYNTNRKTLNNINNSGRRTSRGTKKPYLFNNISPKSGGTQDEKSKSVPKLFNSY